MSQPKTKFQREIAWPVILAGTITLCSGLPAAVPSTDWLELDKLGHFAAYGTLATAIARIRGLKNWPLLGSWWALPLASFYGLADEFRQSLTLVRSADWHDWAADTLGGAVAAGLYLTWPAYRRLLDRPILTRRPKPRIEISPEPLPNSQA